jgi:hypothetical protein
VFWVTGSSAIVGFINHLVVELAAGVQYGIWISVKQQDAVLISGIVLQAVFAIGWRVNSLNLATVAVYHGVYGVVYGAILARTKGQGLKAAVTFGIQIMVNFLLAFLVPILHILVVLSPAVVGSPALVMLVIGGAFPVVDYLYFKMMVGLMDVAEGASDDAETQEKYATLQEVDFVRGSKICALSSSIILVYMVTQANSTFMVTMLGNVAGELVQTIVLILRKRRSSSKIHDTHAEQEQEERQEEEQDEIEQDARLFAWSEFAEKYCICFLAVVSHTLSQYNIFGFVSLSGQVLVGRVMMWLVAESVCNIVRSVLLLLFTHIDTTQVSLKVNLWDTVMIATMGLSTVLCIVFGLAVVAPPQ